MRKQKKLLSTSKKVNNPHNNFLLSIFESRVIARIFFTLFVFPIMGKLFDLRTLKRGEKDFITEGLDNLQADMTFLGKWKKKIIGSKEPQSGKIGVLVEHQSTLLKNPHFKLASYVNHLLRLLKKEKRELIPIVSIFIYNGKRKWKVKTQPDYFSVPDERINNFIGNFEYQLIALREIPDEELKAMQSGILIATFLLLKHFDDKDYIIKHAAEILGYAAKYEEEEELWDEFILPALIYIDSATGVTREELGVIINSIHNNILKDKTMTALQEIKLEGKIEKAEIVVINIISTFPNWSNEKIAELAAESVEFVIKVKEKIKSNGQLNGNSSKG